MSDLTPNPVSYQGLIDSITDCLTQGRVQAAKQVNAVLLQTYWQIGRYIVEFEQAGQERAEYGSNLLAQLSKDLKASHGKGFSRRNVLDMRRFYLTYPNWQTVSAKLSWSHYTELLAVSDELARSFYEQQCIQENWSVRELKRQKNAALFERVALSDVMGQDQLRELAIVLVSRVRKNASIDWNLKESVRARVRGWSSTY